MTKEIIGHGAQATVYAIDASDQVEKVYRPRTSAYTTKDPRYFIAIGEAEAWNLFYCQFDPKYATARVTPKHSLILPKIDGIPICKLPQKIRENPEFQRKLRNFKHEVSSFMMETLKKPLTDQKDDDIFMLADGTFMQLDFGEFGEYKLKEREIAKELKAQKLLIKFESRLKQTRKPAQGFTLFKSSRVYHMQTAQKILDKHRLSATQKLKKIILLAEKSQEIKSALVNTYHNASLTPPTQQNDNDDLTTAASHFEPKMGN